MATLRSLQSGSSPNYLRYVTDQLVKTDRLGDPDLLDFTVAATDNGFVPLVRGSYIIVDTDKYPAWFTGFITNDPEYTYTGLDEKTGKPMYTMLYEAQSDECLLAMQSLGIVKPFTNMTQGQILIALADQLLPGFFDTSGIQGGQFLARYVVDPMKTYADIVKEFSTASVARFWCRNRRLFFGPQDLTSGFIAPVVIDTTDPHFTPEDIQIRATKEGITNECVVLGSIEAQDYVTEYFVGDGSTAQFQLMRSVFGVESAVYLDDDFSSSQVDTSNWTVYDETGSFIQVSGGFLNFLGGNQNNTFDVHLDSANLIPIAGNLRLTHGDFDFVDGSTFTGPLGVIGGLWTDSPSPDYGTCLYGIEVKRTASGKTILSEVIDGAVSPTNVFTVDFGKRYVLRTTLSTSRITRQTQSFNYLDSSGIVRSSVVPPDIYPDLVMFTTHISEIDPTTGLITAGGPVVWQSEKLFGMNQAAFAVYILGASNDLHLSVTSTTLSTPYQATLQIRPEAANTYTQQIIGPNEVDALDGQTPVATVTQSGGITQKTTILGSPKYQAASPTLVFFKNSLNYTSTIPNVGDSIEIRYREAGAAVARVRDQASVTLEETNWGDSGVRSVTRNDLKPAPVTSAECEAAAAAIVSESNRPRFEGTVKIYSDYTHGEPLAGMALPFLNMDPATFAGVSDFAEMAYEVKTTYLSSSPDLFQHEISFGKATDQLQVQQLLAGLDQQSDVFTPQDSAEVPTYVTPGTVGLSWSSDLLYLSMVGLAATQINCTAASPLPSGLGIEVRATDTGWGADNGKNLLGRYSTQTFSVPRNNRNRALFARLYDTRNQWLWSDDLTRMPAASSNAGLSQIQAVSPEGGLASTTQWLPSAHGESTVAFNTGVSPANVYGCVTVSVKGSLGATFSLDAYVRKSSGTDDMTTLQSVSVTCNGVWQRVSLPVSWTDAVSGLVIVRFRSMNGAKALLTHASFETGSQVETVFCKTVGTPYGVTSRYSSGMRVNLPLPPQAPTYTIEVDGTSLPAVASITLNLPSEAIDCWGWELRDADNKTIIYQEDIATSSYAPVIQTSLGMKRSQTYYAYTYNLLGEYSQPTTIVASIATPQVYNLAVDDSTKRLTWSCTPGVGDVTFIVESDPVDANFNHLSFNQAVSGTQFTLPDTEFFPHRWLAVASFDSLGGGTAMSIEHTYNLYGVSSFGAENLASVTAPVSVGATPVTAPATAPSSVQSQFKTAQQKVAQLNISTITLQQQ